MRSTPRHSYPWGRTYLLSALAILAVLLLGGGARAAGDDEPPVAAVIPFSAQAPARADIVSGAAEHALRRIKGLRVIGAVQWEKEARESGQGDDLEAMARRLDADVLVTGSLSRRPKGWRLSVDLFDDKGQPLQSFELELLVPEIGPAASFRLEDALGRVIRPTVGLQEKVVDLVDSGPEPAPQAADRENAVPLAEVEGIRPPSPAQKVVSRPAWRPIVEGRLGLLIAGRTLGCGEALAARLNLPCTESLFPLDAGAGLHLDLGLFPLAWLPALPRPLQGLGVSLLVQLPGWRDRELSDRSSSTVRQLRVEAGLRWRWNLGDAVRRPILEAGLLYGLHQFELGNNAVPYPDVQYQYLLPSVGIGSYLTARLGVRAALGALIGFTAGQANEAFDEGNQNPFGPGRTFGFRLTAEGEYLLWRQLSIGLGASLERLSLSFNGSGCTKSQPRQAICDQSAVFSTPPPPAVSEATDLHLGLWIQAGYRY